MKASLKFNAMLACLALGGMISAQAATPEASGKPAAKAVKTSKAKPAPVDNEPELSPDLVATAGYVLTGKVQCEFNQTVDVAPVSGKAGYFTLTFKGKTYRLVPAATSTGAVRMEDKKNGVMWLQIANKSMLMNTKAGQRMVDNCQHPSQKT